MFDSTARYWAHVYAGAEDADHDEEYRVFDEKVQRVLEMKSGFEVDDARAVLSIEDWNLEKAAERLSY
jgi:hypothetical protein